MDVKNLVGRIPEVAYPGRELSNRERIMWTLAVGFVFLVMDSILTPGAYPINLPPSFRPFAFNFTLIAIGIVPILLSVELLQILLRFDLIKLDLGKVEDRRFFYGSQKILVLILAFFASYGFLYGVVPAFRGDYVPIAYTIIFLVFGTLALAYMDEIIIKWGLGSGLGLFISLEVIKDLFLVFFSVPGFLGQGTGLLLYFMDSIVYQGSGLDNMIWFFTVVFATGLLFLLTAAGFLIKTKLPVSSNNLKGEYSMKFFYTSTLAVTAAGVLGLVQLLPLLAGMNTYSQFIASSLSLGELNGIFTPGKIYMLFDLSVLLHLVILTSVWLILAPAVGYFLSWLYGLHIPYLPQSPEVKIEIDGEELRGQVKNAVIISSFVAGLLALSADMFGALVAFSGALITVGYLKRCQEELRGPVKVCPGCGCRGIEWLLPSLWSIWECRNCGYRGTIVIDVEQNG